MKRIRKKENAKRRVFRLSKFTKGVAPRTLGLKQNNVERKFIETNDFVNLVDPLSHRMHRHYILNKKKSHPTYTQKKIVAFLKHFLKEVKIRLYFNESGVFLENFGMLYVSRSPKPKTYRMRRLNVHTRGYHHYPVFVPIARGSNLNSWTMNLSMEMRVVRKIQNMLKRGKRYKSVYSVFYNMYAGKEKTLKIINTFDDIH